MKHKLIKSAVTALVMLSVLTACVFASAGTVYTNTRQLADNLQYINTVAWSSSIGREESFALRLTGEGDAYPIVMCKDTIYGKFDISTMVSYAEQLGKNVLAVVNADFFSMQSGVPMGIVIEDGVYKSSPSGRPAVCFDYSGDVYFLPTPTVEITLQNNGGAEEPGENLGKTVKLTNFNKLRADTGGMYLFSEHFSTVSTRTETNGWFVKMRILEGTPSVAGSMTLEVTETLVSEGAISIGEGYMVLSAADEGGYGGEYNKFAVGDIITMTTSCTDERLAGARYATGGGDILISGGVKTDSASWDSSIMSKNPRTALGILENGNIVSYVIDGRNAEHSVGLRLEELADELLRQGCVYAINFDGGGSTALSVRLPGESEAALVSRPSDGTPRKCSTYILYVTDKQPDGNAKNLAIKNDGEIVLSGSVTELKFTASDDAYKPAQTPADITAVTYAPDAAVDGTVYTAGSIAGTDRIELYSLSTGAYGAGNIMVITEPTSITPMSKDMSSKLTTVRLMPGEIFEFSVAATYYRRTVTAQASSFTFTVTGDIGEMTAPGVFTAGESTLQSGKLTISAGARTAEFNIEIGGFADMLEHWAKEFVDYLTRNGIVKGLSESAFGPDSEIKRGDFMLMLYRAAGQPELSEASEDVFNDVSPEQYYAQAIAWAKEQGVAQGVGDGKFEPESFLTRQQAFTFVYRSLDILNTSYEDAAAEALYVFSDYNTLSDYAEVPTATLVQLGVIEGAGGMLSPEQSFTRAQMAKVLCVVLRSAEPIASEM